jgi:type IV secretory pathway VirB4 component
VRIAASRTVERSLFPEISIGDISHNLIWHKDGDVSIVYRMAAFHEPSMDDDAFNMAALEADNAWAGLPQGSRFQIHVLVDRKAGIDRLMEAMPAIRAEDTTGRLLEEFRTARFRELTRTHRSGAREMFIQERRHYLVATFRPDCLRRRPFAGLASMLGLRFGLSSAVEDLEQRVLAEAMNFDLRVLRGLASKHGLEIHRCSDREITGLLFEILNPTASDYHHVADLSARARLLRGGLPRTILEEVPWAADVSPLWTAVHDDLVVRREHLQLGDRYVAVISLKSLPDRTEPGLVVPLLKLAREKYRVVYSVENPPRTEILNALRQQAALAEGMRQISLVKTNRSDPQAEAVASQSNEAIRKAFTSTFKVHGLSLQIVLCERSPEALDVAVQEAYAAMSGAQGMTPYRETYLLKPAFLSLLPGSPMLVERRRRTLTPVLVDMLPVYDFRSGQADTGIPLLTNNNSLIFYNPFELTGLQPNANILLTGTSGAGKSVGLQMITSGYKIMAACHGRPQPYMFILDNGASYKRFMDLQHDARYVAFSFAEPPGCDVFDFDESQENREEHISRLQALVCDLLKLDRTNEEGFERKKSVIEKGLALMYQEGGARPLPLTFTGLSEALRADDATGLGRELAAGLDPFISGSKAKFFKPNPQLAVTEDVRSVCYDFHALNDHPDVAAMALRLVIYTVRRFSARLYRKSGERSRCFLILDESWTLLDKGTGGAAITAMAAPFIASCVRMGRKEGLSTIGLSQQISDFAASEYGAAIIGNSATKLIGFPGKESVEALRGILRLNDRQVEQLRGLELNDHFREFLLIQGDRTNVVRIPLDQFSRWVFTTDRNDRDRIAAHEETHPVPAGATRAEQARHLLEQVRYLAKESEAASC